MHDAALVDVLDGAHDRAHKCSRVPAPPRAIVEQDSTREGRGGQDALLVVVALGTYAIEELTARAEVEAEVEVVCGLGETKLSARA